MSGQKSVIVVGAGLAGLVASWRLSRGGVGVVLLEREERPGGRLAGERVDGFALSPWMMSLTEGDRRLLAFVGEVGLRNEWLPLRPLSTAIARGGRTRDVELRGLRDVLRIPGVRLREAARLVRLPRLLARYADALDPEQPAAAARLDDRSLTDFCRLYFGRTVLDRFMAPRAQRGAPGEIHEMSRVQFLLEERRAAGARAGLPRAGFDDLIERAAQSLSIRASCQVRAVHAHTSGALRVVTDVGDLTADAVVVATDAVDAVRIAEPSLTPAERDHLAAVRYAPSLTLAAGLCRPLSPRPRELWVPDSEASPLDMALLEPGLPTGRVPGGRGLAWLRARPSFIRVACGAPDDAVRKELLEALDRLCPGTQRTVDFAHVFRTPRAAPRFDVGHYRALANFETVQRDLRSAGRRLYFAGDHLVHPSVEGAVVSAERTAAGLCADLA